MISADSCSDLDSSSRPVAGTRRRGIGFIRRRVALPLLFIVFFLIRPGPLQVFATIDNPFGFGPDLRPILGPDSTVLAASASLFFPFLVLSIVSRYRMSDQVGRQQLKWFILALLVALAGSGRGRARW